MSDRRPLSQREREVLTLFASGLTAPAIAKRLLIKTGTVRAHRENIRQALGTRTTIQSVAVAICTEQITLAGDHDVPVAA